MFTKEQLNLIINNNGKFTAKELSLMIGKKEQKIRTKAWKLGVKLKNIFVWTEELDDKLKSVYETHNKKEIMDKIPNAKWSSIKKRANTLKLKFKDKNESLRLGSCEPLLQETIQAYYWIGFILADGHINDTKRLTVTLSDLDTLHLQKLGEFLNLPKESLKIRDIKNTNRKRVTLSIMDSKNMKLISDKFNIVSNKTYNPPNLDFYNKLPIDLFLALLIGFIDGDGTIQQRKKSNTCLFAIKNHNTWKDFLTMISNKLNEITNYNIPNSRINKNGYAILTISHSQIHAMLKRFIIKHDLPVLNRKWDKVKSEYKNYYKKYSTNTLPY